MAEFKLKQAQRINPNDLAPKALFEKINEDFIPYACYYNKNTILTKNGELMKVIRITGFSHESISSELVNLRETIRDSILKNINTDNFALWINTIRRKKNIAPYGKFNEFFSQALNDAWEEKNQWHDQFVNELYITVIIEGYNTSITNLNSLMRSFSLGSTKALHAKQLTTSYKELNMVTSHIMEDLDSYGAKIIGISEFKDEFYSEPMRFFGKIINLHEDRFPLTATDMSEELSANYGMALGNNSLAVSGNDSKNYAAMFSVKEYQEISVAALDRFLQLPQEFIITQSIDFIDRNRALMELDYQNYILDVSGDQYMRDLSGLEHIIAGDAGGVTDYGKQQITIMLINKTPEGLGDDIKNSLEKLQDLGLVTVREDIFSELCFWSQLPGNFRFLRRQKPINIGRIGGFASLHNFPAGNRLGNYWGPAVTIFRTVLGTPYFFNFHDGKAGHTMIIGPEGSGKTVLLNFLVGQARKFNSKIYYFGTNRSGKIFINALEGNYLSLNKDLDHAEVLKLCPLSLKKTPENIAFLKKWFRYLVHYGKDKVDEKELELIPNIVDQIISQDIRRLSKAAQLFNKDETKHIYQKLVPWHSDGKYAFIFDHDTGINFETNPVNALDLTPILSKKLILVPVISYVLHKIENRLDGTPAILVLDEAWELIDNYATGPGINDFLKRLQEKNCIIIFATKSVKNAAKSNITESIHNNVATQIFLPDQKPTKYYKTIFGLNDEEFSLLSAMDLDNRHFLLKHGEDSVIASLDLSETQNITSVLSSSKETLFAMDELKKKYGKKSKDWVPEFLDLIENLT